MNRKTVEAAVKKLAIRSDIETQILINLAEQYLAGKLVEPMSIEEIERIIESTSSFAPVMDYHIEVKFNGEFLKIASFLERQDRDDFLLFLQKKYKDMIYRGTEEKGRV